MGSTALGQAPDIPTLLAEQLVTTASSQPSRIIRGRPCAPSQPLRGRFGVADGLAQLLYPQGTLTYKIWTLLLTRFPAEPARVKQVSSPPGTGEG